MILNRKAFTGILILTVLSTSARSGVVEDAFDGYNARYGGDFIQRYNNNFSSGGNLTKGSIRFNTPSVDISGNDFVNIKTASLKGSCNGVDWDFGGISFLNSDKAVQFIETVAQQAPMMIAYAVIQQLAEPIFTTLAKIQDEAKKMMSVAQNSCQAAKSIARSALSATGFKTESWFQSECSNIQTHDGDTDTYYNTVTRAVCGMNAAADYIRDKRRDLESSNETISPARLSDSSVNLLWESMMYNDMIKIDKPSVNYSDISDPTSRFEIARAELLMNIIGTWRHNTVDESAGKETKAIELTHYEGPLDVQTGYLVAMCGFKYLGIEKEANWDTYFNGKPWKGNSHIEKFAREIRILCATNETPKKLASCGTMDLNLLQCVRCSSSPSTKVVKGKAWASCNFEDASTPIDIFDITSFEASASSSTPSSWLYNQFQDGIAIKVVDAVTTALHNIDSDISPASGNPNLILLHEYVDFDMYKLFNIYHYQPKVATAIISGIFKNVVFDITNKLVSKTLFTRDLIGVTGQGRRVAEAIQIPLQVKKEYKELRDWIETKESIDLAKFNDEMSYKMAVMQRIYQAEQMLNNSIALKTLRDKKTRIKTINGSVQTVP